MKVSHSFVVLIGFYEDLRVREASGREKILNFRGLETKNFDFWRSGEVQGEKILNFRGPETENIDFWRSGEVRGGAPGGVSP